ncbi:MAG: hypothetical protein NT005_02325, partial [Spirochaetes bacterium]|nr:hypothetical protein [Spirochaetota bacterium]
MQAGGEHLESAHDHLPDQRGEHLLGVGPPGELHLHVAREAADTGHQARELRQIELAVELDGDGVLPVARLDVGEGARDHFPAMVD